MLWFSRLIHHFYVVMGHTEPLLTVMMFSYFPNCTRLCLL